MMACADSAGGAARTPTRFSGVMHEVEATFGSELADGMRAFLQGQPAAAAYRSGLRPHGHAPHAAGHRAARWRATTAACCRPSAGFIDEYIYDDPLGLSFGALGKLQELNIGGNYTLCDDYLFSKDMTTLLVFISPHYQSSDTGIGDRLVERIEVGAGRPERRVRRRRASRRTTYGGPAVAAYNARQIKRDMMLTLNIAILDHRGVHHPLVPQQARRCCWP